MGYSDYMSRSGDVGALIPVETEQEIFKEVPEQSAVLSFARRLRDMTRQERQLRVVDGLATAYFVGGTTAASSDKGRLQTSSASWGNLSILAAKLGVIIPIPRDVLSDADYDIFGECKPMISEAIGKAIDAAIIHGTNAPTDWPTCLVDGATAASQTVEVGADGADIYDTLLGEDGVIALVEESGYAVNGHIAQMGLRAKMRGLRTTDGIPVFTKDPTVKFKYALDGEPVNFNKNGALNASEALMISGDWSKLVYSLRKGMEYEVLKEASIHDADDNLVFNLAQDDMIALKVTMRMGWQLPIPPNNVSDDPYPFAIVTPETSSS